jgi:hypothetical protein
MNPQALQEHCWLFTEDEVLQCRAYANSRKDIVKEQDIEDDSSGSHGSAVYTTIKQLDGNVKIEKVGIDAAQLEQDEYVIRHFCRQIQICLSSGDKRSFGMSPREHKYWRVCATSILYFRRFYLNNSLLIHDPRVIMLGSIMLASKTEEARIENADGILILNPKLSKEKLIQSELFVLSSLNYQTKVYHPQNILQVIIADMKRKYSKSSSTCIVSEEINSNTSNNINDGCDDIQPVEPGIFELWLTYADNMLNTLQITNVCLIYTPLQLVFAVLYKTENLTIQNYKSTINANSNSNSNISNISNISNDTSNDITNITVKDDVISITLKSKKDKDKDNDKDKDKEKDNKNKKSDTDAVKIGDDKTNLSSILLSYFTLQFGYNQTVKYRNIVDSDSDNVTIINKSLNDGYNCIELQEISIVKNVLKELKKKGNWSQFDENENENENENNDKKNQDIKIGSKTTATKVDVTVRRPNDPPLVSEGPAKKKVKRES